MRRAVVPLATLALTSYAWVHLEARRRIPKLLVDGETEIAVTLDPNRSRVRNWWYTTPLMLDNPGECASMQDVLLFKKRTDLTVHEDSHSLTEPGTILRVQQRDKDLEDVQLKVRYQPFEYLPWICSATFPLGSYLLHPPTALERALNRCS